ncbi:hypothetical protein [Corynebacterium pseudotuberculosis]|uniref:DUF7768 domain-containing protein n=1 Tax=Corynebacterium pseudotuberculosis TaxID=1719 RepID=UPI001D13FC92|nr:hypothetical protein [Corynebacterium pseudotuberculosis]MEB3090404.1 hypothetical protein [Corynebacterium pseudotuberculosis]
MIDASPVEVIDLVSGEQLPSEVLVSLVGPADEFAAHRIRLPPLVYICSPYSGDVEINVQLAHDFCARAVIRGGKNPLAPHLHYPQFMDDICSR